MDPVTTAILTAIATGVVAGATQVGEQVIVDTYNKFKDLLKRKYGKGSEVIKAVEALEAKPNSAARKEAVQEEVLASKANEDSGLLQAAMGLIEIIKSKAGDSSLNQTAIGDQNIQVKGDSNTINVNTPKPRR